MMMKFLQMNIRPIYFENGLDKMHKGTVRKVEKERLRQVEKALVLVAQLGGATCIAILPN